MNDSYDETFSGSLDPDDEGKTFFWNVANYWPAESV